MKKMRLILLLCLIVVFANLLASAINAQERHQPDSKPTLGGRKPVKGKPAGDAAANVPDRASDEELKAEIDAALALPPAERIERLQTFIKAHAGSSLKGRATELLVSTRAALGDEKLKAGDAEGGVEQFQQGITEAPAGISDKLFVEVISQLPANLFLRGQSAEAFKIARLIEAKVKDDPKRLLTIAAFYLSVEQADEAARIAELAVKLAPDMAAAHQALGAAHRIAFRLDDAASEFARALELDPRSASARRSLADLRRATGKAGEALALYREQLAADPKDKSARAGVVLSLFDSGKKAEAEGELQAALRDDPQNLSLLVGASYWYAAHGEGARALELAQSAVSIEPRYTWAHIALGRALIAQKRPLDAERALRFALQYGHFPTLSYELANALAAAGLYEEAATELARAFTLTGDQIETRLADRIPAQAASFIELLAPERRASFFQPVAADSEDNARMLKGLLAFHLAIGAPDDRKTVDEAKAVMAASNFTAGNDEMRAFRQLYVASRLLQRGVALQTALDLTEAAKGGVEPALDAPTATVAVLADQLHDIRARAIASNTTPNLPPVQRNILSKVLRGRIEDLAGWALFNQGKAAEAVVHLRRAVSVLPENTTWWGNALWHLGAALDASGNQAEALATYIKSYDRTAPDPVRRAIIEALYIKVNGSLDGLDARIGPPPATALNVLSATSEASPQQSISPIAGNDDARPKNTETNAPSLTVPEPRPAPVPVNVEATPTASNVGATPTSSNAGATPMPSKVEATPAPSSTPEPPPSPKSEVGSKLEADSKPTTPPASSEAAARSEQPNRNNTSYDKSADLSVISSPMMRLHEATDVLDLSAGHISKGPQLRSSEGSSVLNFQYTYTGSFNAIPVPSLLLVIDGKREPMGELEVIDRKSSSGITQASFRLRISFITLQRLAQAKHVEGRLGTIEFVLTPQHLEALRDLVSNIPQ